jgi:glutamine amidotransferase
VKYNAGNNFSVLCALRRLGVEAELTADPERLRAADKVIFPGVGEAAAAMAHLKTTGLDRVIASIERPLLGICIGQQLLCRHSAEGDVDCIGVFDTDVLRFPSGDGSLKVPHMGWNTIDSVDSRFWAPEIAGKRVYYVHSYYVPVNRATVAVTDYITPFSAAMNRDNFYATQFHPEKSGGVGELVLKKFLEL